MALEKRTIQSIIAGLKNMVESRKIIDPVQWVDAALFLQILKFDEQEKRLVLEITANKKKKEIRQTTESNADADLEWKTTEEYKTWKRQEELLKDILEFCRIAKKE